MSSPVAGPEGEVVECDNDDFRLAVLSLGVPPLIAADIFCPASSPKRKRRGFDLSPPVPEESISYAVPRDTQPSGPSLLKRLFGAFKAETVSKRMTEADEMQELEKRVRMRMGQRDFENGWRRERGYQGY